MEKEVKPEMDLTVGLCLHLLKPLKLANAQTARVFYANAKLKI